MERQISNIGAHLVGNSADFIGVLEVYIHQARDIHNVCIYHNQDVYAKFCLTSDPENIVSTQIVNGGGKNPVFNENLRLSVRTIESSLKCELWMLSRVKNYLEDQSLGFALVPLSEVLRGNGKLSQEFSLSSTDLFHSPAGFVQLSLSYNGASPEVVEVHGLSNSLIANIALKESEIPNSISNDYENVEFPDPKIANENHLMVSEYFAIIPCADLDSQSSEHLGTSDTNNRLNSDIGVHVGDTIEVPKNDTSASSVSTNGSPLPSPRKDKNEVVEEVTSDSSNGKPSNSCAQSVLSVEIEPEETILQQEIVDMYMKSMQQFTESLAKMKLPMDMKNETTDLGNVDSGTDEKLRAPKATSSKVFYGSRAFF